MWTDGGDHDGGDGGVDHRGAGGHDVGGAPRRRRDDEAVALDGRDELPVQVQVDVGQVGRGTSVNHNLKDVKHTCKAHGCFSMNAVPYLVQDQQVSLWRVVAFSCSQGRV